MNVTLKEVFAAMSTVVTLFAGAWIYIDSNYAHAQDVKRIETESVQTLQDLRRSLVAEELNYIYEKRSHDKYKSPSWENAREQKLKLKWDTLYKK